MSYQLIQVNVSALDSILCVVLRKQQIVLISRSREQLSFDIVIVAVLYK